MNHACMLGCMSWWRDKMKSPCLGCSNRKVGCHASCDAYLTFESKNKALRDKRSIQTMAEDNPVKRAYKTEYLRWRARF